MPPEGLLIQDGRGEGRENITAFLSAVKMTFNFPLKTAYIYRRGMPVAISINLYLFPRCYVTTVCLFAFTSETVRESGK